MEDEEDLNGEEEEEIPEKEEEEKATPNYKKVRHNCLWIRIKRDDISGSVSNRRTEISGRLSAS